MGGCFCVSPTKTAFLVGGVCFIGLGALLWNTAFFPVAVLSGIIGAFMLAEVIFSEDDK